MPAADLQSEPIDIVVLDFDYRYRRRLVMTGEKGTQFLLDLPKAAVIADGDALVLEDGNIIGVRAQSEPVAEIWANDPEHMARISWHLGNRHLPTQIVGNRLRIRKDHVMIDLVKNLGATVEILEVPFHPEGGAYDHHHSD
jgi:urease accessory protein